MLLLEIGIAKYFLGSQVDKEGFFFILLIVIQCFGIYSYKRSREHDILSRV